MLVVRFLLLMLMLTTPATLIFDGPIVHGFVIAAAAVSIAILAIRLRPGEAGFLLTVIRPGAVLAAAPAVWMLVQMLPLKTFANPIWESAAAALGRPLSGSISIDPGATLVSLARYLAIAAIGLIAAAIAVDRQRAERLLFALALAATLVALLSLAAMLGDLPSRIEGGHPLPASAATDIAALGTILALAAGLHTLERGKTQKTDKGLSIAWPSLLACLVAALICSSAVIAGATKQTYFAAACGVGTLCVTRAIRRFGFGPWGYAAIISVALVLLTAIVTLQPDSRTTSLTLAFANQARAPLIAVTQRVLTETSWAGTGAGTFAAILPIYRDIDELAVGSAAPNAAAAIAVEMGRPFLWVMVTGTLALAVSLVGKSRRRGRDSIHAATGASCLLALVLLAFGNAGVFATPVSIVAAAAVGTAIAQSKSRTS